MSTVSAPKNASRKKSQLYAYTDNDHSAVVAIVTIVASLIMLTVIALKISLHRTVPSRNLFDFMLIAAALALICQTVLTAYSTQLGLGKKLSKPNADDTDRILQLQYASSLIAIVAVTCAKVSLNLVIVAINDMGRMFYASRALFVLIILSSISAFAATAFQCPTPTPWQSTDTAACPNAVRIYKFTTIMNMITDAFLCLLAVAMIWVLESRWMKVLVIALFGSRILCPITLIPSLTDAGFLHSDQYTWLAGSPTIWRQISFNLSVVTACIPSLKAVLDMFTGNTLMALAPDAPLELEDKATSRGLRYVRPSRKDMAGDECRCTTSTGVDDSRLEDEAEAAYCTGDDIHKERVKSQDGSSESTRKLTDDVIHVREDIEICFESQSRTSLRSVSSDHFQQPAIWDGKRGQHSWSAN